MDQSIAVKLSARRLATLQRWADRDALPIADVLGLALSLGVQRIAECLDDHEGKIVAAAAVSGYRGLVNGRNPAATLLRCR